MATLRDAKLLRPRCHAACVVVDTGDDHTKLQQQLLSLLRSVQEFGLSDHDKILLVWFGSDFLVCQEIATLLGLAPGAVLFRGPLVDALEVACPGAGEMAAGNKFVSQILANFLTLLLLLGLCTEDLLLLGAQQVTSDVNTQLAAMANAKTAKTTKCEVVAFLSESHHEPWLLGAFQEFCDDPFASYICSDAKLPAASNLNMLFFRHRSWARLATWVREFLRMTCRLVDGNRPLRALAMESRNTGSCISHLEAVTAKGVRRLNSVQFEGYAPTALATKLGRFRCMEMVNWYNSPWQGKVLEARWLAGPPYGWRSPQAPLCLYEKARLDEWLQEQEALVGGEDPSIQWKIDEAVEAPVMCWQIRIGSH
eukprot:symbB.v1.2.040876.t1/scaffold7613.1/size10254/1